MQLPLPVSIKQIAEFIGAKIIGDKTLIATGINEIHKATKGDIIFVDVKKYFKKSLNSDASIIILNGVTKCPEGKALLLCDNPFAAYKKLTQYYRPFQAITQTISETSNIGEGTILEPNVVIGHHVKIGKNCHIHANVTIYNHVEIGDNVIIHSGSVIGGDAFYYKVWKTSFEKWHSCGRVILHDHVEIGACCTIDKGVSGDTIIGKYTKLDNHCHIGHGVEIGEFCILAAQVGVAGKTKIGNRVTLYGQVGVSKSLTIGDNVLVSAQSGVSKSLEGDKWYFGSPAADARDRLKELAALRQLPEFLKKASSQPLKAE